MRASLSGVNVLVSSRLWAENEGLEFNFVIMIIADVLQAWGFLLLLQNP